MTNYHQSLRELMYFLKDDCLLSQGDLADGLGISRTVINKYFKDQKYRLPISRENLISLYDYIKKAKWPTAKNIENEDLTPEQIKQKLRDAPKLRQLIASPDELLEMAGYLPEHNKSLQVSPTIFQMIVEIATNLELLSVEDVQNLIFDFKSLVHNKSKQKNIQSTENNSNIDVHTEDTLDDLIDNIVKSTKIALTLKEKLSIKKKLQKIQKKLAQRNKKRFAQQEALALLISIAVKEKIAKDLEDLSIRLEKIEYHTLSFSLDSEKDFKALHRKIWGTVARQEEWKLVGYDPDEEDEKMLESDISHESEPILLARLTCIFRYENQQENLTFIYMSNNTLLENAIAAIGLNLGFSQELENVDFLSTKVLSSDKDGLVETTVILKEEVKTGKNKYYQATWVELDTFKATLQAILSASIHWLSYHARDHNNELLKLENYQSICMILTKVRQELLNARRTLNDFQFLDRECGDSSITKIVDDAIAQLKQLQQSSYLGAEKISEAYRINFYFCYLDAQLIRLRKFNTQGNIEQVKEILDNIEETPKRYFSSEKMVKENFAALIVLRDVEDCLYKFSIGCPDIFALNFRENLSKIIDENIQGLIHHRFYKDTGLDVYQSLSEVYGNLARLNFYLCHDKDTLIEARESFLKAAYHASRIGARRRTAKWITFAARVNIRLGNQNDDSINIEQYLDLSETIINKGVSEEYQTIFKDALLSERYLLRGELHFMRKEYKQAFDDFLLALKGSIYLGFNRRISDSLYNLYRCYERLGGTSIKARIEDKFKELFIPNRDIPELDKTQLNPQHNVASGASIELLNNYLQNFQYPKNNESFQNNPNIYIIPTDSFLNTAKGIWNEWYIKGKNSHSNMTDNIETDSQHPVAILMDEGKWLSILED